MIFLTEISYGDISKVHARTTRKEPANCKKRSNLKRRSRFFTLVSWPKSVVGRTPIMINIVSIYCRVKYRKLHCGVMQPGMDLGRNTVANLYAFIPT